MRLPEPPIRDLAEKGFAATHPLLLHVQVHAVLCGAALHFVIHHDRAPLVVRELAHTIAQ